MVLGIPSPKLSIAACNLTILAISAIFAVSTTDTLNMLRILTISVG
jgi:hypothetical protein